MKKKTKYRLKNSLTIPYWIAVFICLICACLCLHLFHNSFFRALTKLNEKPIAEIEFKYRTAQRKFLERIAWDRLQQHSPVYNGDTINTAELSEATIRFIDGTILELADNSMAQVFLHDDGTLGTELKNGFANINSAENSSMILTSDNITLNVQGGTTLSAQKAEGTNDISLSVQDGNILLSNGQNITGGTALLNSQGITDSSFTVSRPLAMQKILNFSSENYPVNFEWQNSDKNEPLILQISTDKGFNNIIQTLSVKNLTSVTIDFPKGTYYWKLYSETKSSLEKNGRIQIIQALKPVLLSPSYDFSYKYRKSTPPVRFIWSESEAASAYNLVISKNADLSNPLIEKRSSSASYLISTLEKGIYYWQITPFYSINKTGLANPSEIGTFRIEQNAELKKPAVLSPKENGFVNKNNESITLSWKADNEAAFYNLIVSDKEDLSSNIISIKTDNNFYTIPKKEMGKLKEGKYYWTVALTDEEGNMSERSEVCSFYVTDGKIEQRTIFPQNNYSIWQPLLTDIRFTWKTRLPFKQNLQISKDSDFRNLVLNLEVNSTSYSGVQLKEGTYYWRIYAKEGSLVVKTDPKRLNIVGELEAPSPIEPSLTKKCAVRPDKDCIFNWKPVPGADYYRFRMYKNNGDSPLENNGDSPLIDNNFITGTTLAVNMKDFEEGFYKYEIQAFCYESDNSSRRSSALGKSNFILKKIKPVELISPADRTVIDGWTAVDKPLTITWQTGEIFADAQLIITKKNSSGNKKTEYDEKIFTLTDTKFTLPGLAAGEYEWTVKATTYDDLDISAAYSRTFRIEEIKPFDPPAEAQTDDGNLFDAAYIRNNPSITFRWQSVPRAKAYILTVYKDRKQIISETLTGSNNTSFEFKNLALLSRGDFIWKVKAVILGDDKKEILIDGKESENTFTIDFNLNSTGAKRKNTGALYGQ